MQGFSKLHPHQELAVKTFVSSSDMFVCLPAGSDKSLCYSLLPSVFDLLQDFIFRGGGGEETKVCPFPILPCALLTTALSLINYSKNMWQLTHFRQLPQNDTPDKTLEIN